MLGQNYKQIGGNGAFLDFLITINKCLISNTNDSDDENLMLIVCRRTSVDRILRYIVSYKQTSYGAYL